MIFYRPQRRDVWALHAKMHGGIKDDATKQLVTHAGQSGA